MTVIEAINGIDAMKPNGYSQPQKIEWLSTLDGMIKRLIVDSHEGSESVVFKGYDENSLNQELLIPAPFDGIYLHWLEAKIDYANGEYGKYNNAIITYNNEYEAYAAYYTRTHKPKRHGDFRF